MKLPVSPLVSRALALTILGVVLFVTVNGIILPLFGAHHNAVESATALRAAIDRVRLHSGNLAALRAEVADLKMRDRSAPGFLQSTNPALAAAELQGHLKTVVTNAHGELLSTQVLSPREEANARRITVRGEMIVDISGLQRAVYTLEAGSPMLFLDNVEISPRPTSGPEGTTDESSLDVRFDLYGYMRSPS